MTTATDVAASQLLFRRAKVSPADERIFIIKLLAALTIWALGATFATAVDWWPAQVLGVVLVGAMYTHWLELQHQCLHHSGFRRAWLHRVVGVPLGLPMLVSYSHYRVRHLQHHRYLGTEQDSEFFGFDTRQAVTWGMLLRQCFDVSRLLQACADIVRSWGGRWQYDQGQISEARRREVIAEYRMFVLPVLASVLLALLGGGQLVLRLWLLPLLVAVPLHFLVELPEHIMCETDSTDVLRNTRTITGSAFSRWFTNGNNLHIEHHAAMVVPINRLGERHGAALELGRHTVRSYPRFYRAIARVAGANSRSLRTRREAGGRS